MTHKSGVSRKTQKMTILIIAAIIVMVAVALVLWLTVFRSQEKSYRATFVSTAPRTFLAMGIEEPETENDTEAIFVSERARETGARC
jgi:flagellar basal body-associated protein FliL